MSYTATFTWPYPGAYRVVVTGDFDNWTCSVPLKKINTGFTAVVDVPYSSKVHYKFLVDGQWLTRSDVPTEWDGSGNLNNIMHTPAPPPDLTPEVAPKATSAEEKHNDAVPVVADPAPKVEPPSAVVPAVVAPVVEAIVNIIPESKPTILESAPGVLQNAVQSAKDAVLSLVSSAPSPVESKLAEALSMTKQPSDALVWERSKTVEEVPKVAPEAVVPEVPAPEIVVPTELEPVVETKPEDKPVEETTGTGLGINPVAARAVIEELELSEEKVQVSETAEVPKKVEAPAVADIPAVLAQEASKEVTATEVKPEETPTPQPPVVTSVPEVPRPSTPPPKSAPLPAAVPTTPPPKTTSSAFSSTTGTTTTASPAAKTFPGRGEPDSPVKSLKKDSSREKRHSLYCKIKHAFSHK